jgi:hypothetical protein
MSAWVLSGCAKSQSPSLGQGTEGEWAMRAGNAKLSLWLVPFTFGVIAQSQAANNDTSVNEDAYVRVETIVRDEFNKALLEGMRYLIGKELPTQIPKP